MVEMRNGRIRVAERVDGDALWKRILDLARHGATEGGGVRRLALSDEEMAARRLLLEWADELGLAASTDPIGNLFFRLEGLDGSLPPVLTGSHIDSQPSGGKFDGAFGVAAGFEAVRVMMDAGFKPRRPIEIVVWMNEEGSRFSPGMMGSEAFSGRRSLESMLTVADDQGITVAGALQRVAAMFPGVRARPLGFPVAAFVEAHIEQGPILEANGKPVGIVSGIQGSRRFRVTVTGENAHAGTTPRQQRKDALFASADMICAMRAAFERPGEPTMFTVGLFDVTPNAPSVVPSRVFFSIDLRHPDGPALQRYGDLIAGICDEQRGPCAVSVRETATAESLQFPESMQRTLRDVARDLELPHMSIFSAAGHDARQLHYVCPAGMIFVPCADGLSHNEKESCQPADLAAGAMVLSEALCRLAE